MPETGDLYGGWQPETLTDLLWCEDEEYVTPVGVIPDWVLAIEAAVAECRAGHPNSDRARCGVWPCAPAAERDALAARVALSRDLKLIGLEP